MSAEGSDPVVVLGAGFAGWSLARELRRRDGRRRIVVVTRDAGDRYPKSLLSSALALGRSAVQMVDTPAAQMAETLAVELHAGIGCGPLDVTARTIDTDRGRLRYGGLVMAVGAAAQRLPLAGDGAQRVLSVSDLQDYAALRERLVGARSVVILGAGLAGCELANDLAAHGYRVALVEAAPWPVAALLPRVAGDALQAALALYGVRFRFGRRPVGVSALARGCRVVLDDGAAIDADVVLSAVGLRPRIGLAQAAGLAVARGVLVDRYGRTTAPDVYALGDCAQYPEGVLPFETAVGAAARAIACSLSGEPARIVFGAMPVTIRTPACPIVVQPAPRTMAGLWRLMAQGDGMKLGWFDDHEQLRGFVLTGAMTGELGAMTCALAPALARPGFPG